MTHSLAPEAEKPASPAQPRPRPVCVDAGLVVKLVSAEPDSLQAEKLFQRWRDEQVEMIAPNFAAAETDSVLRHKVV